jgi:prolyl oligopeptidase PreP (S9A serine peptidase family)
LFPSSEGYAPKALISKYAPIISIKWSAILLWQGGKDDQVPPITFKNFVAHLKENRNEVILYPKVLVKRNLKCLW